VVGAHVEKYERKSSGGPKKRLPEGTLRRRESHQLTANRTGKKLRRVQLEKTNYPYHNSKKAFRRKGKKNGLPKRKCSGWLGGPRKEGGYLKRGVLGCVTTTRREGLLIPYERFLRGPKFKKKRGLWEGKEEEKKVTVHQTVGER